MNILEVIKDEDGIISLRRVLTVLGSLTLTYGFIREAISKELSWEEYIAYPTGMLIMYSTSKAIELIKAIKGNTSLLEKSSNVTIINKE